MGVLRNVKLIKLCHLHNDEKKAIVHVYKKNMVGYLKECIKIQRIQCLCFISLKEFWEQQC